MNGRAALINDFINSYVKQEIFTTSGPGRMTGDLRVGSDFLIRLVVFSDSQTVKLDIIKAYHLAELRPLHRKLLDSLGFHRNGPGLEFSFADARTVHTYAEIASHFCVALLSLEDGLQKLGNETASA